ncbi:oxidoreductase [Singulisphaera sp. PoT]|uniref:oxidoreductase n=1 Tax=Singulisphaera sp. PoT TaxID=3411797 RepID=UPI003BF4BF26
MAKSTNGSRHQVWFITGTSQGFGRELVRAALGRGYSVVATSRTPDKVAEMFPDASDRLHPISLDLRDELQIASGVASAIEKFGHINVLVNNAGHGLLGAIEEASGDEVQNVFETNVFGLLRVTRAVLPHFRERRSGHIVNISSIGGLTASPGWGLYNSTKFAVEGLSEALAQEVAPLGIRTTIVEPGPFRTDFLGSTLHVTKARLVDYDETAGKTRTWREEMNGAQVGDPVLGSEAIIDAVNSEKPPLRLLLGISAYDRALKKLDANRSEFEAWRELTCSTDYKS